MSVYSVQTLEGDVSVWDSLGRGKPVLFIHGNSACKEVFCHQFEDALAQKYRFIAVDLLGHGISDRAKDPISTYTVEGHALVIIEVMKKLNLDKPVVVGWSLGGHIGLNLIQKSQKLAGIFITGTPPIEISQKGFEKGFQFNPELAHLFDKVEFSEQEASKFMQAGGIDVVKYPFIVDAAFKTDGYVRKFLMEANMRGNGGDQKAIVESDNMPLTCVVQGKNEANINNNYILNEVKFKNLFNQVYIIDNARHAVFLDQPEEFNEILSLFLAKVYS